MGKRLLGRICCLHYCQNCDRVEFMMFMGPFFYRCSECRMFVPRDLET